MRASSDQTLPAGLIIWISPQPVLAVLVLIESPITCVSPAAAKVTFRTGPCLPDEYTQR